MTDTTTATTTGLTRTNVAQSGYRNPYGYLSYLYWGVLPCHLPFTHNHLPQLFPRVNARVNPAKAISKSIRGGGNRHHAAHIGLTTTELEEGRAALLEKVTELKLEDKMSLPAVDPAALASLHMEDEAAIREAINVLNTEARPSSYSVSTKARMWLATRDNSGALHLHDHDSNPQRDPNLHRHKKSPSGDVTNPQQGDHQEVHIRLKGGEHPHTAQTLTCSS